MIVSEHVILRCDVAPGHRWRNPFRTSHTDISLPSPSRCVSKVKLSRMRPLLYGKSPGTFRYASGSIQCGQPTADIIPYHTPDDVSGRVLSRASSCHRTLVWLASTGLVGSAPTSASATSYHDTIYGSSGCRRLRHLETVSLRTQWRAYKENARLPSGHCAYVCIPPPLVTDSLCWH